MTSRDGKPAAADSGRAPAVLGAMVVRPAVVACDSNAARALSTFAVATPGLVSPSAFIGLSAYFDFRPPSCWAKVDSFRNRSRVSPNLNLPVRILSSRLRWFISALVFYRRLLAVPYVILSILAMTLLYLRIPSTDMFASFDGS